MGRETIEGPWGGQGRREAQAWLGGWGRGDERGGHLGDARLIESFEKADLVVDSVRIQGYKWWRRREWRRRFERFRAILTRISDSYTPQPKETHTLPDPP